MKQYEEELSSLDRSRDNWEITEDEYIHQRDLILNKVYNIIYNPEGDNEPFQPDLFT
jgi:hypothetical protein